MYILYTVYDVKSRYFFYFLKKRTNISTGIKKIFMIHIILMKIAKPQKQSLSEHKKKRVFTLFFQLSISTGIKKIFMIHIILMKIAKPQKQSLSEHKKKRVFTLFFQLSPF